MRECIKVIPKKLCVLSLILNSLYSIADYSMSFVIAYYAVSPFDTRKLMYLLCGIAITQLVMLIAGELAVCVDNINDVKIQTAIQKYYFKKINVMSMEQISNSHTGYIHNLVTKVARNFSEIFWQIQMSVIPILIGGVSIFVMVCKESLPVGILCIVISTLAVYLKYKVFKNKQKYQKEVNEIESKYNATFVDFVQNIMAVRKLNIVNFCESEIEESSEKYVRATRINEKKKIGGRFLFTGLMNVLYIVVILSTLAALKEGKDVLPYILFYISALGKLYYNLNSLARLIYINQKFNTIKRQLDECFRNSIETKTMEDFKTLTLKDIVFSYNKESAEIYIPNFTLNKGD